MHHGVTQIDGHNGLSQQEARQDETRDAERHFPYPNQTLVIGRGFPYAYLSGEVSEEVSDEHRNSG
jgi:hypothetical protein